MSYSKSLEPRVFRVAVPAQVAATTTCLGFLAPFAGEVTAAQVGSTADHTGDNGTNYYTITVTCNGNTAITLNTGATDVNAAVVAFPTKGTVAARRFASGEAVNVVFTKTSSPVNFEANAFVNICFVPLFDHANE